MQRFFINLQYAWNSKKPKLMWRLVVNLFKAVVLRKTLLRYVDTSIGTKCNLHCAHCFSANDKDGARISPALFSRVAAKCMQLGAVTFSFQGGEPLLYPDLKDYIAAARPRENLISVSTNGTLLTDKKMTELKSWGVDILTVSVDRYHEKINLLNLIVSAREAGLKITFSTVLTHELMSNTKEIEKLGDLAGFCYSQGVILLLILAVPEGRWEGKTEVMLNDLDMALVREIVRRVPYVRTDFDANYFRRGCGAAKEILFIKSDGSVFCCPFIDIPFGNIYREDIAAIREKMLTHTILKEYAKTCLAGEKGGLWKRYL